MIQKFILIALVTVLAVSVSCDLSGPASDQPESVAQTFVANLTSGNTAALTAALDTTMASTLTEPQFDQVRESLRDQFGVFYGQAGVRSDTLEEYTVVYVTMDFEGGKIDAKIAVTPDMKIAGLVFAPSPPGEYAPPAYVGDVRFTECAVSFGDSKWILPGTLSTPDTEGTVPAVILVHGSGPKDRDGTLGGLRPFTDIAWGLASRGIAVLRYDKRTMVHGFKMASSANYTVQDEVIEDVLAARELLTLDDRIDKDRIYVLGHSLGGMLLPRILQQDSRFAGMICMAGNTRPLVDALVEQTEYLFKLYDSLSMNEREYLDSLRSAAILVQSDALTENTPTEQLPMGICAAYWLDLKGYAPHEAARDVSGPMLFMQGERDYQVTMEDFENWRTALESRQDVTFKTYPMLNHLFVPGEGQPNPEEYFRPGHIDEQVVLDIAAWILSH